MQAHVSAGKFDAARTEIRALPNSPADMVKVKQQFVSQIAEAETEYKAADAENLRIMSSLSARGLDVSRIPQIARENGVDMSNPMQLNALLKAIQR